MTTMLAAPDAPPAPAPAPPRVRARTRIAGLDGLRALAVSAVVAYHLGLDGIPGGFLGVDIFFVISGFLITTLLLAEVERTGRIGLRSFYARRARRLLPALFLMLAATLVLAATVASDVAAQTARDTVGALAYISNWWALGQEQSYFELIGRGNLLGHLWSLAVEEQFYLLWPLLLAGMGLLAARAGWRLRRIVLVVAAVGALASTAWMATLAVGGGMPLELDPTRVYFGTDTHAMSVLVGAALAAVWNVATFRRTLAPGARALIAGAGVGGLLVTGWLLLTVTEYTPWLYRGGFLVAAGVFALVVAAATHPGAPLGRVLDNPPMRWVGERSYGIYLWHWPILLVTRPGADLPWTGAWVQVARVALVLVVAEASYRYVEVPVRRGALAAWWRGRRAVSRTDGLTAAWLPRSRRATVALGCAAAAAAITAGLLVTAPTADEVAAAAAQGATADIVDSQDAADGRTKGTAGAAGTAGQPAPEGDPAALGLTTADISWYGDSVSLWAVEVLRRELPGVRIDAGLNRSPRFIMDRALADQANAAIRPLVVMHLGNGGPVPGESLGRALTALADRTRVVLVNSTARFAFVRPGNATLAQAAAGHPNVVLVDWAALSEGHPEWFTDGLHLSESGKVAFAAAVRGAMLGTAAGPGLGRG